jgi:hypothetical protein
VPVRYVSRDRPRTPAPVPPFAGEGPPPEGPPPARRSHAAAFVAIGLLALGVYLASWTVIAPALLALLLFSTAFSFLAARINPLSIGFYLTVKPSWTAIGTVVLSGLVLAAVAYSYWKHGWGPILPHRLVPW